METTGTVGNHLGLTRCSVGGRQALQPPGGFGHPRLLIGKTDDSVSTVSLKDAKGRARLVMKVTPGGDASIEFLDENGKAVRAITP